MLPRPRVLVRSEVGIPPILESLELHIGKCPYAAGAKLHQVKCGCPIHTRFRLEVCFTRPEVTLVLNLLRVVTDATRKTYRGGTNSLCSIAGTVGIAVQVFGQPDPPTNASSHPPP